MTTLCPKRRSNTLLSKSEFATYMHPKALRQQIRWPQKSTWTWKPNQNQDSSRMPCPPVFWPGFCLRFLVHPSETMRNVTWRWFVAPVLFHWTLPLNNRKKMPYGLHLSQFPHLLTTFKFMWSIIAYSNFFAHLAVCPSRNQKHGDTSDCSRPRRHPLWPCLEPASVAVPTTVTHVFCPVFDEFGDAADIASFTTRRFSRMPCKYLQIIAPQDANKLEQVCFFLIAVGFLDDFQ